MINTQMRYYNYHTLGEPNAYGQIVINRNAEPEGVVKLAINTTSTSIQDNVNYKDALYVALTLDKQISDKYIIHYGDEKLKVIYTIPFGRYIQVFLKEV